MVSILVDCNNLCVVEHVPTDGERIPVHVPDGGLSSPDYSVEVPTSLS